MTLICSIYELEFPNGKKYIGISNNPDRRWNDHCRFAFKYGKNSALYNAMRAHGKESIKRRTLLISTLDYCREMEIKLIASWKTQRPNGYNILPGGDMSPFVTNPELAKAQGLKMMGRKHSEEAKERMSLAQKGIPKSDEHCKAISQGRVGMKFTPEHAAKCAAARLGKVMPDSARLAISEYQKSNPPMHRPGVAEKVSAARMGMKFSESHKEALRAAWVLRKERSSK